MSKATQEQQTFIFIMASNYIDHCMHVDGSKDCVPSVAQMRNWCIGNLPTGTRVAAIEGAFERLHSVYWLKS